MATKINLDTVPRSPLSSEGTRSVSSSAFGPAPLPLPATSSSSSLNQDAVRSQPSSAAKAARKISAKEGGTIPITLRRIPAPSPVPPFDPTAPPSKAPVPESQRASAMIPQLPAWTRNAPAQHARLTVHLSAENLTKPGGTLYTYAVTIVNGRRIAQSPITLGSAPRYDAPVSIDIVYHRRGTGRSLDDFAVPHPEPSPMQPGSRSKGGDPREDPRERKFFGGWHRHSEWLATLPSMCTVGVVIVTVVDGQEIPYCAATAPIQFLLHTSLGSGRGSASGSHGEADPKAFSMILSNPLRPSATIDLARLNATLTFTPTVTALPFGTARVLTVPRLADMEPQVRALLPYVKGVLAPSSVTMETAAVVDVERDLYRRRSRYAELREELRAEMDRLSASSGIELLASFSLPDLEGGFDRSRRGAWSHATQGFAGIDHSTASAAHPVSEAADPEGEGISGAPPGLDDSLLSGSVRVGEAPGHIPSLIGRSESVGSGGGSVVGVDSVAGGGSLNGEDGRVGLVPSTYGSFAGYLAGWVGALPGSASLVPGDGFPSALVPASPAPSLHTVVGTGGDSDPHSALFSPAPSSMGASARLTAPPSLAGSVTGSLALPHTAVLPPLARGSLPAPPPPFTPSELAAMFTTLEPPPPRAGSSASVAVSLLAAEQAIHGVIDARSRSYRWFAAGALTDAHEAVETQADIARADFARLFEEIRTLQRERALIRSGLGKSVGKTDPDGPALVQRAEELSIRLQTLLRRHVRLNTGADHPSAVADSSAANHPSATHGSVTGSEGRRVRFASDAESNGNDSEFTFPGAKTTAGPVATGGSPFITPSRPRAGTAPPSSIPGTAPITPMPTPETPMPIHLVLDAPSPSSSIADRRDSRGEQDEMVPCPSTPGNASIGSGSVVITAASRDAARSWAVAPCPPTPAPPERRGQTIAPAPRLATLDQRLWWLERDTTAARAEAQAAFDLLVATVDEAIRGVPTLGRRIISARAQNRNRTQDELAEEAKLDARLAALPPQVATGVLAWDPAQILRVPLQTIAPARGPVPAPEGRFGAETMERPKIDDAMDARAAAAQGKPVPMIDESVRAARAQDPLAPPLPDTVGKAVYYATDQSEPGLSSVSGPSVVMRALDKEAKLEAPVKVTTVALPPEDGVGSTVLLVPALPSSMLPLAPGSRVVHAIGERYDGRTHVTTAAQAPKEDDYLPGAAEAAAAAAGVQPDRFSKPMLTRLATLTQEDRDVVASPTSAASVNASAPKLVHALEPITESDPGTQDELAVDYDDESNEGRKPLLSPSLSTVSSLGVPRDETMRGSSHNGDHLKGMHPTLITETPSRSRSISAAAADTVAAAAVAAEHGVPPSTPVGRPERSRLSMIPFSTGKKSRRASATFFTPAKPSNDGPASGRHVSQMKPELAAALGMGDQIAFSGDSMEPAGDGGGGGDDDEDCEDDGLMTTLAVKMNQ